MSQPEAKQPTDVSLETGTYEIIRNRLRGHGEELRQRLDRLNQSRREVFGSIETTIIGTERITTENNCVPRDMVAIGRRLLFGYNVHLGLRAETKLSDVFAVYDFVDGKFQQQSLDGMQDEQFQRDFREIYRYYKNAVFSRFFSAGPHLYMVFQVGKSAVTDIKTFKWLVAPEIKYVDNRSDHEVRYPSQHEFDWTRTHRDLHRPGQHPHISIEDRLFVETIGGDLTIKVENNTDSGAGIYSEPVENKDQTLDDAEIFYAVVGHLIVLRIRPYQEPQWRHIVFSEKVQQARRIDAIEQACVLLPDDQGLIFPNGYCLQTGEYKTFDQPAQLIYERRLAASNGEDFLYVFYNHDQGLCVLLPYNLIERRVGTPIICNGYTLFPGGELICFKTQEEPQRHHAIQIWRTPYVSEEQVVTEHTGSFLYKVGNRDIVRGMAEARAVLALLDKDDTYSGLYVDLVKATTDVLDSYFWLDHADAANLREPLQEIRTAAAGAVEEFEKVVRVRQHTAEQTKQVSGEVRTLLTSVQRERFENINDFVRSLANLRRLRGNVIALRDLRYVETQLVDQLEQDVTSNTEQLAGRCVQFLLRDDALRPYEQRIANEAQRISELTKVADARRLEQDISASATELEMLIEIVANLKIDDATQRTTIIDRISAIFSQVNQARAGLKARLKEMLSVEGAAEFNSQIKLLNQSVANYLDVCSSPAKCDESLTRLMVQIEELEGRFAEFDEFVVQLTEKREEVYQAFETRKLSLVEARNKRATALMSAADRILKGIKSRVDGISAVNDIHAYFAADLMIEKVRDVVRQLQELDDSVKADDIQSRLKTIREDAVRQLKDRQDLFEDGDKVIRFGKHRFSVNVQPLDLTTVQRDGQLMLHVTGTNFFERIDNTEIGSLRDVWDQEVVSENSDVYRGEYLALTLLRQLEQSRDPPLERVAVLDDAELLALVQRFMATRYAEAYSKGVHDLDAAKLLRELAAMHTSLGLLRYSPQARALAAFAWRRLGEPREKEILGAKLRGYGQIAHVFPQRESQRTYIAELAKWLEQNATFCNSTDSAVGKDAVARNHATLRDEAAEYLFHELTRKEGFAPIVSRNAVELFDGIQSRLKSAGHETRLMESLKGLAASPVSALSLAREWGTAFLAARSAEQPGSHPSTASHDGDVDELAVLLVDRAIDRSRIVEGHTVRDLTGFLGSHAVIQAGTYRLDYHRFMHKLSDYEREVAPRYRRFVELKKALLDAAREDMRLEEFRPRVLTSFVRNRLIVEVYLPLIGDNLAKQMGTVGEQKRTDRMGLLLLVSPPGYGKTTLMEYIANRIGLIFMKINGPAIGHAVTSLDTAECRNAAAREEIEKLNLALEMGDNVMLYVDDIQHTNPEFLQKFISLCDAQRKIEGIYKGRTQTYDLRGKKVCVVMAGNPYTESGEKFQIPDMLANRADVYNLGEIIGDSREAFELSYLENALTSNSVLNKLATRSQKDVHAMMRMAMHDTREGVELEGNYTLEELNEFTAIMKKLLRVRDVLLTVNREYIRSAAQSHDYRTEPPFKLQGSYRNMNRIAEKVVAIMNDQELETLISASYENDAQTLTSDQESNLLKLKELQGRLSPQEQQRWDDIRRTFQQNVKLRGLDPKDHLSHLLAQLGSMTDGLNAIRTSMNDGLKSLAARQNDAEQAKQAAMVATQLAELKASLDTIAKTALSNAIPENPEDADGDSSVTQAAGNAEAILSRVMVQHQVPRVMLEVIQSQFEMMRAFLAPILNSASGQREEIKLIQQTVDATHAHYAAILSELQESKTEPPAPPPTKAKRTKN